PVEAARSQQGRIEHIRTVGGRQDDDALARAEPVHLGQNLVERLLLLGAAAREDAAATGTPDGVELVDEYDRRRRLTGLLEQVTDSRRADADDDLDKLRGTQAEERHAGLAGHRPRQQGLAGSGRADQQDALRHGTAQSGVLWR